MFWLFIEIHFFLLTVETGRLTSIFNKGKLREKNKGFYNNIDPNIGGGELKSFPLSIFLGV